MTDNRHGQEVTRRNYKRKTGLTKGGKIVIWTIVFLLCFFVPFFIIYFGSGNEEQTTPIEIMEGIEEITPEARIYQLEQENEQLRIQIRDLETKLDEISLQNALSQSVGNSASVQPSTGTGQPADNNGWEELPSENAGNTLESAPSESVNEATTPAEPAPSVESDPSLFGNEGL